MSLQFNVGLLENSANSVNSGGTNQYKIMNIKLRTLTYEKRVKISTWGQSHSAHSGNISGDLINFVKAFILM